MDWQSNASNYLSLCDFVLEMQGTAKDTAKSTLPVGGHFSAGATEQPDPFLIFA
jgi:hypothetical protein